MDFRYGDITHPAGGVRFGSVGYELLGDRVIYTEGSYRPGETVTVHLVGSFDFEDLTVRLGGIVIASMATASAAYFTVPSLHTNETYDMLNYGTLSVSVEDDSGTVETTVSILPPAADTYLASITGSPWPNPSSIFYTATGLVNGDSALIVLTEGGPIVSATSDGLLTLANPAEFTVYPYSQNFGWGSPGAFQVTIGVGITFIPSPIFRGQTGVKIVGYGFGT